MSGVSLLGWTLHIHTYSSWFRLWENKSRGVNFKNKRELKKHIFPIIKGRVLIEEWDEYSLERNLLSVDISLMNWTFLKFFSVERSPISFCYEDRTLLSLCDSLHPCPQIALSLAILLTLLFNLRTDHSGPVSIALGTLSSLWDVGRCVRMSIHFNKIGTSAFGHLFRMPNRDVYGMFVYTLCFVSQRKRGKVWRIHLTSLVCAIQNTLQSIILMVETLRLSLGATMAVVSMTTDKPTAKDLAAVSQPLPESIQLAPLPDLFLPFDWEMIL